MGETTARSRNLRFGTFEVDLQARELRKRGIRVRLQEKPFRILELLLQRQGEIVSREELQKNLWPDSHVGFDRSLNTAINTLRHALGDSASSPRFVETCQRRGYRFIAPVERLGGISRGALAEGVVGSIAVLPFRNESKDPETEYLSDGITETIIHVLSQLSELRVMARSTVFRYKDQEIDPRKVGLELGVNAVIIGRLLIRGESLNVGIELVDAENGWRLWGDQYEWMLSDIFSIQDAISKDITDKLRLRLTVDDRKRLATRFTNDADAYRDYLKGRFYFNRMTEEGLGKSVAHFEQAIRRDPSFALAYAGLSDCHSLSGFFSLSAPRRMMPLAKQAAMNALRIDDSLAEAHASLASILMSFEWNWAGAEKEYRRAIALNPNYATGHHLFADFLSAMGRPREAMKEISIAQELDPLSLVIGMEVGWNYYMAREYDLAVDQLLKTLDMEPEFSPARYALGLAYEQLGKMDEAIGEIGRALAGSHGNPASLAALGHVHGITGDRKNAESILRKLEEISRTNYLSFCLPALVSAGLGQLEAAIGALQRAVAERDVWLVWLNVDPRFDSLRGNPAFGEIIRTIGLRSDQGGSQKPGARSQKA